VVRAELLPVAALEHDGDPVALPAAPLPTGVDPNVGALGYVEQMRALERAVRAGERPPGAPGAEFGRRVLEVVCGAYASAGSGGPVPLPFAGPRDRTPLELWRG
jgi:predicted dehydrogenase